MKFFFFKFLVGEVGGGIGGGTTRRLWTREKERARERLRF